VIHFNNQINDFTIEGIFHEAAIASVPRSIKNPIATTEANIIGTLNVPVAAKDCGVRKIVFASSSSVYGDTPTLLKHEDREPYPLSPNTATKESKNMSLINPIG